MAFWSKWFKRKDWGDKGILLLPVDMEGWVRRLPGWIPATVYYPQDKQLIALNRSDFDAVQWKARDLPGEPPYTENAYDCDNFATGYITDMGRKWARLTKRKAGLAVGQAKGWLKDSKTSHRFTVIRFKDGSYEYREPQTDKPLKGEVVRLSWIQI